MLPDDAALRGHSAAPPMFNNTLFANCNVNPVEAAGGGLDYVARRFGRNPLIR